MKKLLVLFLAIAVAFGAAGCSEPEQKEPVIESQVSQMKSICELAVMECYYHNVAKFMEEDAESFLWWTKDKHFWIEYSGIVTLGIDVSLVNIEVNDCEITITLPEAQVQSCKVDSASLTENSYIVDKNSAAVTAEDEILAFEEAQRKLEETASKDKALLAEARQRAQSLLEDYVENISKNVDKEYYIRWIYIDSEGKTTETTVSEIVTGTEESTQVE